MNGLMLYILIQQYEGNARKSPFFSIIKLLTHLSPMNISIPINWTNPFPILGVLGGIFHFPPPKFQLKIL